jgi:hypothetical protein
MKLYTTWESFRQGCSHAHRSVKAGKKCILADHRSCRWHEVCSDRFLRVISQADEATEYHTNRGPGEILPVSVHTSYFGR